MTQTKSVNSVKAERDRTVRHKQFTLTQLRGEIAAEILMMSLNDIPSFHVNVICDSV